jgi:outer membrane protein assembly factor BamB
MKRRLIVVALVVVIALAGAGTAYYFHVKQQARDIEGSSTVEFVTTEAAAPPPREPGIAWPTYGHDAERQRFANGVQLAPPFRTEWTFRAQSLVEFPPAIGYGRLFFANNAGILFAIGAKNGRRAWKFDSHRCVAASPALDRHVVYEAFLNVPPCNRTPSSALTGEVVALAVGTGRVLWRHAIGPSESSPVVVGASVFVGDWAGRVWALRRRTGRPRWVTMLRSQVKSGVAISGNRIYVGDYSGHLYSLNKKSGKIVWEAKVQPRFGSTGNFYATPALAYGRVYIGATDGKEYSFGAASGKLRWSQSTGGYVYSSAAVWRSRIYVGSYSHAFFCFDAATGDVLWHFNANGPISGSPTVIAGRVYFATLKGTTYALDAKTGALSWTFPDGKYSPVVADAQRLYLVGYAKLYGLGEKRTKTAHTLSATSALRALRQAGLHHVHVVGAAPLTIRVGVPPAGRSTIVEHVCHIAVRGGKVNVRWAGGVLQQLCR